MPSPSWVAAATTVSLPTPENGPLAGYAHRTRGATGTADPLEADLLLLEDGSGGRLLWISIDTVAVGDDLHSAVVAAVARSTQVLPEQVVCVASHTHAAPAGWVGSIHPVLPAEVDHAAIQTVAETIAGAAATLSPAPTTLGWAEGRVDRVGSNRHDPDGPTDQSIGVLLIGSRTHPVAVVYDYACHPTVLGPDNRRWSADWVGAARARLREHFRPGLPVLFLQGCAGDQSTRFHRRAQDFAEVHRLGGRVGDAIVAALPAAPLAPGRLDLQRERIVLPTRSPDPLVASDLSASSDRVAASVLEGRRAREATINAKIPAQLELPVTVLRIGARRWLHCSVELYCSGGQQLKAAADDLRVVGYTDGYHSYLADPAVDDDDHYEAMSSYFDREQTSRFVERCLDLIR